MNEVEKKALERYPHDYPERSGYIEGYKAALESVKEMIAAYTDSQIKERQP